MSLPLLIRPITTTDSQFVYDAICDLKHEPLDQEVFETLLTENLANPNYLYLLAEVNTQSVGLITFHVQNLLHHCGPVGEIQEFYVTANFRGKGVGKALNEAVLNYAFEKKLASIEVSTNKKREENVEIYRKLGFKLSHNKFTIYL